MEVLARTKQGFSVPLDMWFAKKLPKFFREHLGDGNQLASFGIKPSAVGSLMDLYSRYGRSDHCRRLWALVVLDRSLRGLIQSSPS